MKKTLADIAPRRTTILPPGFAEKVAGRTKFPLGEAFGLTQFGVNLTELAPGAVSSFRHWHSAEDEFVYILEGEAVLVTDAGEEILRPGDFAGFRAGNPDGHRLLNRTDAPVRLLEIGTRAPARDQVNYPDDDLELRVVADGRAYFHKDGTRY